MNGFFNFCDSHWPIKRSKGKIKPGSERKRERPRKRERERER